MTMDVSVDMRRRNFRSSSGGGGGGGASPALKFNVTTNSQYIPVIGV